MRTADSDPSRRRLAGAGRSRIPRSIRGSSGAGGVPPKRSMRAHRRAAFRERCARSRCGSALRSAFSDTPTASSKGHSPRPGAAPRSRASCSPGRPALQRRRSIRRTARRGPSRRCSRSSVRRAHAPRRVRCTPSRSEAAPIALPDSWTVMNSYQGCVEAASRQDHGYLAFGCPQAAVAPPLLPGTDPRSVLIIASADPVAVLRRVLTAPSPAGLGVSGVRIAEVQPVAAPMAGGRAAYVLFDYIAGGARVPRSRADRGRGRRQPHVHGVQVDVHAARGDVRAARADALASRGSRGASTAACSRHG